MALYNLNHTQWGEEVTAVVSTSIQDVCKVCEVGYVAVVAKDLEQQAYHYIGAPTEKARIAE